MKKNIIDLWVWFVFIRKMLYRILRKDEYNGELLIYKRKIKNSISKLFIVRIIEMIFINWLLLLELLLLVVDYYNFN